jgi:DNA-binding XRE family transcriptional regulator
MSIGTRIIQLRNQRGWTQQQLGERTGLAASYLSRIENRHLEPSPHTLTKIATALEVPISEIFQERAPQLGTLQCMVTSSGTCILNLLRSGRGSHAHGAQESYGPRELQLLRMANYIIQTGDARRLDALDVLLGALVQAQAPAAGTPPKAAAAGGEAVEAEPPGDAGSLPEGTALAAGGDEGAPRSAHRSRHAPKA